MPPHMIDEDASEPESDDMMPLKSIGEVTLPPHTEGEDPLPPRVKKRQRNGPANAQYN